jgi:hypothetical protein
MENILSMVETEEDESGAECDRDAMMLSYWNTIPNLEVLNARSGKPQLFTGRCTVGLSQIEAQGNSKKVFNTSFNSECDVLIISYMRKVFTVLTLCN